MRLRDLYVLGKAIEDILQVLGLTVTSAGQETVPASRTFEPLSFLRTGRTEAL